MHIETKARNSPYVWATWITKLLAGESQCKWSAWFKAHYNAPKVPSNLDLPALLEDQAKLIRRATRTYANLGFTVTLDNQNKFHLREPGWTLGGKPHLIAFDSEGEGWVVDVRTGRQPWESHRTQVLLYMWALPRAVPEFKNVQFQGQVIYPEATEDISPEEVTPEFESRLRDLLEEVSGSVPPEKVPGATECGQCSVTADDCGDRFGYEDFFEPEGIPF